MFGKVDTGADKSAAVKVAVASVATRTRPWCQVVATSARMRQLTDLERAVQEQQPDLRLVLEGDTPSFRGSFQLANDGVVFDRFSIRITFPDGRSSCLGSRKSAGAFPSTSIDTFLERRDLHRSPGADFASREIFARVVSRRSSPQLLPWPDPR